MRTNLGNDIAARWVYINGERAFVLRGPEFVGFGIADAENVCPQITRQLQCELVPD